MTTPNTIDPYKQQKWEKFVDAQTQGKGYSPSLIQDIKKDPHLVKKLSFWENIVNKLGGWYFIISATALSSAGLYLLYRFLQKKIWDYSKHVSEEELQEELENLRAAMREQMPEKVVVVKNKYNKYADHNIFNGMEKEGILSYITGAWDYVTNKMKTFLESPQPSRSIRLPEGYEVSGVGKETAYPDPRVLEIIKHKGTIPPLGIVLSLLINPPEDKRAFGLESSDLQALETKYRELFPSNEYSLAGKLEKLPNSYILLALGGGIIGLAALLAYLRTLYNVRQAHKLLKEKVEDAQDVVQIPAYRIIVKESSHIASKENNIVDKIRAEIWEDIEYIYKNTTDKDIYFLEKLAYEVTNKYDKGIDNNAFFVKFASSPLGILFNWQTVKLLFYAILASVAFGVGYLGYRLGKNLKLKSPTELEQLSDLLDTYPKYQPYSLSSSIQPEIIIQKERKRKGKSTDEE